MIKRLQKIFYLTVVMTLILSCNTSRLDNFGLESEINKRIDILNSSYKFSIIPTNLQNDNYKSLKLQITKILKSDSKVLYDSITYLFDNYNSPIQIYSKNKTVNLYNILIGLDNLIFKYVPSRLNFSDYKTIVVPNKTELKSGDTLKARIYLSVSDSLYEPEYKYLDDGEVYNLPSIRGIGQYNLVARKKGIKKIKGQAIYSNELGSKDTIDWSYEFEIQ